MTAPVLNGTATKAIADALDTTTDKLFLFSVKEVTGTNTHSLDGEGTPEPKRSGTSRKTSNGNGGRTENPHSLAVGNINKILDRREIKIYSYAERDKNA